MSSTKLFENDLKRPLPKVEVFDSASVSPEQIVAALTKAGGCVIKNAVSPSDLSLIQKDVQPFLDADKPWEGDFFPRETRRVNGLAAKSKVFMEKIVCYEPYQSVCSKLLSSTTKNYLGQDLQVSTSQPQLNNTIVFAIGPGAKPQPLHRDDMIHHRVLKQMNAEDYVIGQDTGIGFFVGGRKTTKANGATRFIPGSHLWDHDTPPSEDLTFYAELDPGDAFVMLSSCYHGGSANTTEDEVRLVYSCFMTKGYLRQEENQYLNNDPEKLKELYDDTMLRLIGYNLSAPFLGWIKEGHPLAALGRQQPLGDMY
ncbi:PhyH-domain-containing protein [Lophium mytilinum]|uniref:PhyH-domain-containing protein n=1 Tax=Lophium mytilinum TaxID=390894 RepID=A0A6A6RDN2_9PEZI|nr:PhyH-domain-containing protein [Lophium mytilinum]